MNSSSAIHGSDSDSPKRNPSRVRLFFSPTVSPVFSILLFVTVFLPVFVLTSSSITTVDGAFAWKQIEAGNVEWVDFSGETMRGCWRIIPASPDNRTSKLTALFNVSMPLNSELRDHLLKHGSRIREKSANSFGTTLRLAIVNLLLLFLFVGITWVVIRRRNNPDRRTDELDGV